MSDVPPAVHRLADFATGLSLDDVPDQVRRQAALSVLDTLGCIVAGSVTAEARTIRELHAGAAGSSTAVGHAHPVSAEAAAGSNGYAGDVFELNDLTGGHASIGVVPAALAVAEELHCSGADLLRAVIAGIEVATRVYNAFYPTMKPYTDVAITPAAFPNAVGAAAAVASLARLDPGQAREALAIAATLSAWSPVEATAGPGSSVKPILFGGWPAGLAVTALAYARAGVTGPPAVLESPVGYLHTVSTEPDPDALDTRDWALAAPRRKLHACCGYTHSAVDAMLALRRTAPAAVAHAGRIEVRVPSYVLPVVGKLDLPGDPNAARFHLRYAVTVAAALGTPIEPRHSEEVAQVLADPAVRAVFERVAVEGDDSLGHYHCAVVEVRHPDGIAAQRVDAPVGSPLNPMGDDAVLAKFARLAEPVLGGAGAGAVADLVTDLAGRPDLRELAQLLRQPPPLSVP